MAEPKITVKCESEETDIILEALEEYAAQLSISNINKKSVKCRTLFERIKKATDSGTKDKTIDTVEVTDS